MIFDLITLSLLMIYFFFSFISLYSFFRTISSKSFYSICIPYYIGLTLCGITRGGVCLYCNIYKNKKSNFFYFLLSAPDLLIMCVYLILIWHFLNKYIINHINLANDKNIFKEDVPEIINKINYVLYFLLPIYLIGFFIISFLQLKKIINNKVYYIIISSVSIFSPFNLIFFYCFLSCKFSGRPYKDNKSKKELNYILFICLYWSTSRIIIGITILIIIQFFLDKFKNLENLDFNICIGILVYFIIIEIVPFYFSINFDFSKTFSKDELFESLLYGNETREEEKIIDASLSKRISSHINDIENNNNNKLTNQKNSIINYLISFKDISLLNEIYYRKNGLGKIYKGIYKSEEIICRVVKFDRLSRYELETITKDYEHIIPLNNPYISKIIGLCIEQDNIIMIISNYYKKGSLFDLLHVQKEKILNKNKINIAIGIIKGLQYLHSNNIIHYHLSSKNIYIDNDLNPVIADYGFYSLEENASIFNKYSNKNSYSSPEMLLDSKKFCHKLNIENNEKNDIYSFGMILWEIFNEKIPFDVKLSELKKYIIEEKLRPEVSSNLNKNIAELIRNCWDSDIDKRPNIDQILSILLKVSNDNIND